MFRISQIDISAVNNLSTNPCLAPPSYWNSFTRTTLFVILRYYTTIRQANISNSSECKTLFDLVIEISTKLASEDDSGSSWADFFSAMIRLAYSACDEPLFIKVFSILANPLSRAIDVVIPVILEIMKNQEEYFL